MNKTLSWCLRPKNEAGRKQQLLCSIFHSLAASVHTHTFNIVAPRTLIWKTDDGELSIAKILTWWLTWWILSKCFGVLCCSKEYLYVSRCPKKPSNPSSWHSTLNDREKSWASLKLISLSTNNIPVSHVQLANKFYMFFQVLILISHTVIHLKIILDFWETSNNL